MPDWFLEVFGSAMPDIRRKLIDEAWFGRRTAASDSPWREKGDERLGWEQPAAREHAPDRAPQHDFDR